MKTLKSIKISVIILAAFLFSLDKVALSNSRHKVYDIKDAMNEGLVQIKISGINNPNVLKEVVDKSGVHYGKCMNLNLSSKHDSLIFLKIESGTELIPYDNRYQKMIVTKTVEIPLFPNVAYNTRFYAMCGQITKDAPNFTSWYYFGKKADEKTIRLAEHFDENYIQNMIGQHALWAYTDMVSLEKLKNYGANDYSIKLVKELLDKLSIQTNINKPTMANTSLEKEKTTVKNTQNNAAHLKEKKLLMRKIDSLENTVLCLDTELSKSKTSLENFIIQTNNENNSEEESWASIAVFSVSGLLFSMLILVVFKDRGSITEA